MNILIDKIWTFDDFLSDIECDNFIKDINNKKKTVNFTMAGKFKNDKYIDEKLTKYFFNKVKDKPGTAISNR